MGPTRSQASVSAPPRPAVSPAGAPTPIDELCPGDAGSEPFQVVNVTTSDGVSLYAATIGRGPVGLVMANDVPHPLCEELPEARLFAGHGFRVAVFDYRDRGESGSGGSKPGRLDLDVAAAADLLIRQGSPCVALAGSYGGAAAGHRGGDLHASAPGRAGGIRSGRGAGAVHRGPVRARRRARGRTEAPDPRAVRDPPKRSVRASRGGPAPAAGHGLGDKGPGGGPERTERVGPPRRQLLELRVREAVLSLLRDHATCG